MKNKEIEHLGYLFDWQPTIPYHDLCTYILNKPPEGYSFTEDKGSATLANLSEYISEWREKASSLGVSRESFNNSLIKRNLKLNMQIPDKPCWITTLPVCVTYNPWMVEIEDWATLTYPEIGNNHNCLGDISNNEFVKFLKAQYLLPNFRGVVTHIKSTINSLKAIFCEELSDKFHYMPVGIPTPDLAGKRVKDRKLKLFFHGSFNHSSAHFMLRGGREFYDAFERANAKYPNIKLTLVYSRDGMASTPDYLQRIQNHPDVNYIGERVSDEKMHELRLTHDVLGIPAYRIHSITTTSALMYGMPVICSDGWGFDEYITDGFNGLVSKGNVHTWTDEAGIMREKYQTGWVSPEVTESVYQNIIKLYEEPALYDKMSLNAMESTRDRFSIEARNRVLKTIFDKGFADESN